MKTIKYATITRRGTGSYYSETAKTKNGLIRNAANLPHGWLIHTRMFELLDDGNWEEVTDCYYSEVEELIEYLQEKSLKDDECMWWV